MADQLAPLQQFEYLPGMNLRVLQRDGEPWFVATDVCKALDMSTDKGTGQWLRDLDPEEKLTLRIAQGITRGNPNTTIISESGLYLLVLKSRKEEAKAFQKWVTGEVLPSIRKTGVPTDTQGRASRWVDHPVIPLSRSHLKAPTGPRSDGRGWQQ